MSTPTVTGATITALLTSPYVNLEGSGADVVTMTFEARVKDLAANVRGTNITNHALFKFEDNPEVGRTVELPAEATTPVVEPDLIVGKTQTSAPSGIVAPGDTVNYTVTATNSTAPGNVSTAYEVKLVDTIPDGMEVVTGSLTATPGGWFIASSMASFISDSLGS